MLALAREGAIDLILTKSISRFARNTVDLLETVRELKDLEVEVRFDKENISSTSADGELMLTLLASFAQAESEQISQNASKKEKRTASTCTVTPTPLTAPTSRSSKKKQPWCAGYSTST